MFNIGPLELLVIALVALLVVGPEKLPKLAKNIAKIYRELNNIIYKVKDEIMNIDIESELDIEQNKNTSINKTDEDNKTLQG